MIIKDVSPKGITSVVVNGRINKAKASLDKLGFEIISAEENAGLRIERGKDSYVSSNHNCVKEGFVYVPGKGGFVTRQSLVQLYPNEAMKDRFCGEVPAGEFQVTDEQAEEVLEDSIKVPLNDVMVPTERLGENELACYLFGKQVDDYGNFLKDAGKDETYISIMNEEKRIRANRSTKPFARDLWFYGIKTTNLLQMVL